MATGLYFLLLTCSSIVQAQKPPPPATVEKIERNVGLYFERLTELRLIQDDWTYIIYLNLYNDYFNATKFSEVLAFTENNCTPRRLCAEQESQIDDLNHRLTRTSQLYNDLTAEIDKITEDLNVTEKLEYNNHIYELETQEKQFIYPKNSKLHIIKSSLDGFDEKRGTEKTNHFDALSYDIGNLITYKGTSNYTRMANKLLRTLERHINLYTEIFQGAIETIHNLKNRKIYPGILRHRKLQEIIDQTIHLNNPSRFPLSNYFSHIDSLGSISKIKFGKIDGRLLFSLNFPLTSNDSYYLYRSYSLPIPEKISPTETVSVYIKPRSPLLGVSEDSSYAMSEDQLARCTPTPESVLCQQEQPIHSETENASCEFSLLHRLGETDYRNCDIKYREIHVPFWTRTDKTQAWIFSLSKPIELQLICKKKRDYLIVNATGILTLRPGCKAIAGSYQLSSAITAQVTQTRLIFPRINLKIQEKCPLINIFSKLIPPRNKNTTLKRWEDDRSLWKLEVEAKILESTEAEREKAKTKLLIIALEAVGAIGLLFGVMMTIICAINIRRSIEKNEIELPIGYNTRSGDLDVPIEEIFDRFYFNRRPGVGNPNLPAIPV